MHQLLHRSLDWFPWVVKAVLVHQLFSHSRHFWIEFLDRDDSVSRRYSIACSILGIVLYTGRSRGLVSRDWHVEICLFYLPRIEQFKKHVKTVSQPSFLLAHWAFKVASQITTYKCRNMWLVRSGSVITRGMFPQESERAMVVVVILWHEPPNCWYLH